MLLHFLQPLAMNCLRRVLLLLLLLLYCAGSIEIDTEKNYASASTAPPSKYLTIAKVQSPECYFNPHTLL